jgi:hypothetical protein
LCPIIADVLHITWQIAVEIAIASKPEREVAHIKNCLAAGFAQIYGIFADDQLLERTATALKETLSAQDAGKVRLLPLRQLSKLGEDRRF